MRARILLALVTGFFVSGCAPVYTEEEIALRSGAACRHHETGSPGRLGCEARERARLEELNRQAAPSAGGVAATLLCVATLPVCLTAGLILLDSAVNEAGGGPGPDFQ